MEAGAQTISEDKHSPSNVILNSPKASAAMVQRCTAHNSYYYCIRFRCFCLSLPLRVSSCSVIAKGREGLYSMAGVRQLGPHSCHEGLQTRRGTLSTTTGKYNAFSNYLNCTTLLTHRCVGVLELDSEPLPAPTKSNCARWPLWQKTEIYMCVSGGRTKRKKLLIKLDVMYRSAEAERKTDR